MAKQTDGEGDKTFSLEFWQQMGVLGCLSIKGHVHDIEDGFSHWLTCIGTMY